MIDARASLWVFFSSTSFPTFFYSLRKSSRSAEVQNRRRSKFSAASPRSRKEDRSTSITSSQNHVTQAAPSPPIPPRILPRLVAIQVKDGVLALDKSFLSFARRIGLESVSVVCVVLFGAMPGKENGLALVNTELGCDLVTIIGCLCEVRFVR